VLLAPPPGSFAPTHTVPAYTPAPTRLRVQLRALSVGKGTLTA